MCGSPHTLCQSRYGLDGAEFDMPHCRDQIRSGKMLNDLWKECKATFADVVK